ncbi:MAG: hypothetical protein LBH25_08240 [Fibromonadaceae bacterium]|nr:hypothetical protein [Fibromonadaceae bacterium]
MPAVPFGLKAGTKIKIKEVAKFPSTPADIEHDLRRADDLRIAGAFDAAYSNYEIILLKHPDLPAALFGAAYSLLAAQSVSKEDLAKAKRHIESLAKQMPNSVWNRLLITFSMEKEASLNYALEMAAELSSQSPAFAEARLRYADLLLATEQPDKAVNEAKAAISLFGGSDARPFVSLALALHKMGNLDKCAELVNYAMPRFSSQTEFLLLHGFLSEYAYDFDTAQNNYKRILLLKPDDVEALKAMSSLGEKIPPTPGASATHTGTVISLKDMTKEVAKIMLPLIHEYPENLPLREALGRVYLKARLMKEAKAQFSEIYAQDFDYPNIRRLMLEASEELAVPVVPQTSIIRNSKNLTDSLVKTFAELRKNAGSEEYDDLGRYLIHYGVTFKDFFSKYSITRFERIDENTFIEKYSIGSFKFDNTVYFDYEKKFYAMRTIVEDTSEVNSLYYISDLYGHFFKKETGILGEGIVAESVNCDGDKWSGIIWSSRDNYEFLMKNTRESRKVYMLRLSAKQFTDTGNLCSYVPVLKGRLK